MPLIIFEGGELSVDKKRDLVKSLTDAAQQVTGIQRSAFTVIIHENTQENIGVGGELLKEYLEKQKKK